MSKDKIKEEMAKEVDDAFNGWSISSKAKEEFLKKLKNPTTPGGELAPQKPMSPAQQTVTKAGFKSIMDRLFTKTEKRIYDLLLKNGDMHSVTSPLSQQNIYDILAKEEKPVTLRTIKRCIQNLFKKGLIKIDTKPNPTTGTRYKVMELNEYLTQVLSKDLVK